MEQRQRLVWLLVIIIIVLIFVGWLFSLQNIFSKLSRGASEWSDFRKNWSNIGNIFDEFKINLEKIRQKLPKESSPAGGEEDKKPTLSEEEIKKLEEKILEYTNAEEKNKEN